MTEFKLSSSRSVAKYEHYKSIVVDGVSYIIGEVEINGIIKSKKIIDDYLIIETITF